MSTENQFEQLPDGITLNAEHDQPINIDRQQEVINTTKCNKCNVIFESILITMGSRHEGIVKVVGSQNNAWKNSLPKDRVRCMNMLNEILITKLDKHKERDHND